MISNTMQNRVVASIIKSERGYVCDPDDNGGATNFGITLATLRAQPGYDGATIDTIRSLDLSVAKSIYHNIYVVPVSYTHLTLPTKRIV